MAHATFRMPYAPWQCGTAAIPSKWSRYESIERVDASTLTVEEFARRFEIASRPVILTGLIEQWPASTNWSFEQLRERFGNKCGFHVGGHTMGLSDFFDYCESTTDEQPLYLFDKRFGETSAASDLKVSDGDGGQSNGHVNGVNGDAAAAAAAAGLAPEYTVPPYFAPDRDLASLQTTARSSWLIRRNAIWLRLAR